MAKIFRKTCKDFFLMASVNYIYKACNSEAPNKTHLYCHKITFDCVSKLSMQKTEGWKHLKLAEGHRHTQKHFVVFYLLLFK